MENKKGIFGDFLDFDKPFGDFLVDVAIIAALEEDEVVDESYDN